MRAEIGKTPFNMTWKLLLPCVNAYGENFMAFFNGLYKLGVGIHDMLLDGSSIIKGDNLFIAFDREINSVSFWMFLSWVEQQDYFVAEYSIDDVATGQKHMLVLNIPKEHIEDYRHFLKGEYSKMYTPEFKRKHFHEFADSFWSNTKSAMKKDARQILNNDKERLPILAEEIRVLMGMKRAPEGLTPSEMALPLQKIEEVFHFDPEMSTTVFFNEEVEKIWEIWKEIKETI
jgi:hypothetical protein